MQKRKILISGTSSGLGKFLYKDINSIKFNRKKNLIQYKKINWDCIVHCGAYAGNSIDEIYESIITTHKISQLKSKKFIFISSMITENKNLSFYKISKIIGEKILQKKRNLVVIKLGSTIGKHMRQNTISKLINEQNIKIGLSKKSLYSFVSFSEISNFIKICIKKNYVGSYNFLRNDFITLDKISKKLNKKITFGKFYFKGTSGPNNKLIKLFNLNKKTSLDIIFEELEKFKKN